MLSHSVCKWYWQDFARAVKSGEVWPSVMRMWLNLKVSDYRLTFQTQTPSFPLQEEPAPAHSRHHLSGPHGKTSRFIVEEMLYPQVTHTGFLYSQGLFVPGVFACLFSNRCVSWSDLIHGKGFNFVPVASAPAGRQVLQVWPAGTILQTMLWNSAVEKNRPTPLKEIHWLLCPEQAADAQQCLKTNTRYPVPELKFILLWRKQTWRNPCAAKPGVSGAVDSRLTVNYSYSGPG